MTFANVHFSSLFTPWTYYPHQLIPLVTPALKAAENPNEFVSIDHDLLRKRTMAVALSALALVVAGIIFPVSLGITPGMYLAGICYLLSFFDFDSELSNICRIKKIFQEVTKNDTLSPQQALVILQSEELLESLCALEMDKRKALVRKILAFMPDSILTKDLLSPECVKLVAATADRQIQKDMLIKIVSDPHTFDGALFADAVNGKTLIGFELNDDDWCDIYFACSSPNYYAPLIHRNHLLLPSHCANRLQTVLERDRQDSPSNPSSTNPLFPPLIATLNQKLTQKDRNSLVTSFPDLAHLLVDKRVDAPWMVTRLT